MRETVSEKIRQNFSVKVSPNLFWQEIRQIDRAQSRSSRRKTQKLPQKGSDGKRSLAIVHRRLCILFVNGKNNKR
jgi:hypothetical protein